MTHSEFRESDIERSSDVLQMDTQFTAVRRVDETSVWGRLSSRRETRRHFEGDVAVDDDDRPPRRCPAAAGVVNGGSGEEREEREVDPLTHWSVDQPRAPRSSDADLGSRNARQIAGRLRHWNAVEQRTRLSRTCPHWHTRSQRSH